MARSYAFLLGNGVAAGFDARLTSAAITERVFDRLSRREREDLGALAELLRPETPEPPLDVFRGDFEALAGPVDRMADALLALDGLLRGVSKTAGPLSQLAAASEALRRLYRRIVGIVLSEIDHCCEVTGDASEERLEAWNRLNAFSLAVASRTGDCSPIYTTNYDSLLASSLLAGRSALYDGFPGGKLDSSLRCWGKPALYHLHGSIAWTTDGSGELAKWDMATLRALRVVESWAQGEGTDMFPTVVLGDQKSQRTNRYPFVLFYEEFRRSLEDKDTLVIGGYSFGDRPVNAIVAGFLAGSRRRRLVIWKRSGAVADYIARLRTHLSDEQKITDEQVTLEKVALPSAIAVEKLPE